MNDNYKIIKVLGKGGMSVVYLAEHVEWHTRWAIKQVHKEVMEYFDILAEPNILKSLSHPMLPHIIDINEDDQDLFIIEEYIEGQDLNQYLKEKGPVDEETGLRWLKSLCDVLAYLHEQEPAPIIYRDLKPANIMLRSDGSIHLIDFGIARTYKKSSQADTTAAGTRGYASPEQLSGAAQTDARSDIYSLGITMYHLLTGKSPYEPPYEILPVRKLRPELSAGIEYIVWKCTRKNPEERYQSCREILADIENIERLKIVSETEQKARKSKLKIAIGVVVATALISIGGVLWYQKVQADRAAYEAELQRQEEEARAAALEKEKQSHYTEGTQFLITDEYEQAKTSFEKALDIDPDYIDALIGMGDALQGIAGSQEEKEKADALFEEASSCYQRAAELGDGKKALQKLKSLNHAIENYEYRSQYPVMAQEFYDAFKKKDFETVYELYTGDKYHEVLHTLLHEIGNDDSNRYVYQPDGEKNSIVFSRFNALYYGEYKEGQRTGKGILYVADVGMQAMYDGHWENDFPNGKGVNRIDFFEDEDASDEPHYVGQRLEGEFKDGYANGTFILSRIQNDGDVHKSSPIVFNMGVSERLSSQKLYDLLLEHHYSPSDAAVYSEEFADQGDAAYKTIAIFETDTGLTMLSEGIENGEESVHKVIGISYGLDEADELKQEQQEKDE